MLACLRHEEWIGEKSVPSVEEGKGGRNGLCFFKQCRENYFDIL